MYEKKLKIEFSDLKHLFFSGIFVNRIGGYPIPPLTENHPAQNLLRKWGVPPSPPKRKESALEVVFDAARKYFP